MQNEGFYWGWLTKPRFATNRAHDPNKKNSSYNEPYALFYIFSIGISHSWRFGAGDTYLPTGIRTAAVPHESTSASLHIIKYTWRMGQTLRINSPYLTYAFTMFTYQPYTVARWAIQHSWRYARHDQITVQSEHEPYQSITIRSIRIHYVSYKLHYVPSGTVRTKRTVREPEQSEKLLFAYTSRRISHSSPHFLITILGF